MKDTHFLYGIARLAVVGILACFMGYATNTLPMHTKATSTGRNKHAHRENHSGELNRRILK